MEGLDAAVAGWSPARPDGMENWVRQGIGRIRTGKWVDGHD